MEPVSVLPAAVTDEEAATVEGSVDVAASDLVLADLLVEEISIDGMCGVY